MNIRTAILKAADSIEQNPSLFNFNSVEDPNPECGTPGCVIGWFSHHLGIKKWSYKDGWCAIVEADGDAKAWQVAGTFYKRMTKMFDSYEWKNDANTCAKTLRAYADEYHPDISKPVSQLHTGIPAETLRIFEEAVTA